MKKLFKKNNTALKAFYCTAAIVSTVLLWQLLAVTAFKTNRALPQPLQVLESFFMQLSVKNYYKAVLNTLFRSAVGFLIAFAIGLLLSIAAQLNIRVKYFFDPLVSVLRSVPTLGVTFILLIFFPSGTAASVIGILVTLPLVYANGYAALSNIDRRLIETAAVYKVGKCRRLTGIYLPACTPYLFASVLGGFGLNLKVTIAAETIAIPRLCIGSYLYGAYASADFPLLFAWVLTAVLITVLCEAAIKLAMKLCMPYKYPHRKIIARAAKRIFKRGKTL